VSIVTADPQEELRLRSGRNLQRARKARMNQEEFGRLLAEELGRPRPLTQSEVSRYETGKRYPGLTMRAAMAKVLGLPRSFFDDDGGE
jgi:transcriptional regulator with XRE-family HTH domain